MSVSIIIINHNGYELTRTCLTSIQKHSPESQVILVDNGSSDESAVKIQQEFPGITVIPLKENVGFGKGNNLGASHALHPYLFFLNNDTELLDDAPTSLRAILEADHAVGAIGPRLVNPDSSFQLSFGRDPSLLNEWRVRLLQREMSRSDSSHPEQLKQRYARNVEVDWLTGAALMVRRNVFEQLNGFDESYFMYFEDADLCRRIRKEGWKVLYVPSSSIVHVRGGSVGSSAGRIKVEYRKSQLLYYWKHRTIFSRFCLRLYLLLKFGTSWIVSHFQKSASAQEASSILKLILGRGEAS